MICNNCGAQIRDESVFCSKCGVAVTKDIPESNTICNSCGAQIRGKSVFCSKCGAAVARDTFVQNSSNIISEIPTARDVRKPPNRKKRKIIAIVCSAVVLLAILIPVIIESARSGFYNSAVAAMASDPLGAKADFESLGNYKNSVELSYECQHSYNYNEAQAKMDAGDYDDAKTRFENLGDYKDSADKAIECRNTIDYNAAKAKMDAGDFEGAYNGFFLLGDYSDSADKAIECKSQIEYDKAVGLRNEGSYYEAYDLFSGLGNFKDSDVLAKDCGYKLANQYFTDNKFYSAQTIFLKLGTYLDSASLADKCIRKHPKTGQHHRSSAIKRGRFDTLQLSTPKDGYYTYIKIYKYTKYNNPKLVDTVWLAPGKKVKIKLPGGYYYSFKMGYGKVWYGEDEMFGETGKYSFLYKDEYEDSQQVYFKKPYSDYFYRYWYVYKIKLRDDDYTDGQSMTLKDFLANNN